MAVLSDNAFTLGFVVSDVEAVMTDISNIHNKLGTVSAEHTKSFILEKLQNIPLV